MKLDAILLPLRRVIFSPYIPDDPEDEVHCLIQQMGGSILEDVRLDYDAAQVHERREGQPAPDAVVGRSKADPKSFQVFRYRSEVDPEQFTVIGPSFTLDNRPGRLSEFLRDLVWFDELSRHTGENDTPEVWESIHRSLAGRS